MTMPDASNPGSGNPGSPNSGPSNGQPPSGFVSEEQYKGLERKLGEMGNKLGEFNQWLEGAKPVLDVLDANPELVQAIVDGKVTSEMAKAALEGRLTVAEARAIDKATEDVKKDVGKTAFSSLTPEQVERLVEEKLATVKTAVEDRFTEAEKMREFEKGTEEFIASKPDFAKYAKQISEWLDKHDVADVSVAYYAVKGATLDAMSAEEARKAEAEASKAAAMNAMGLGSPRAGAISDPDIIDQFIMPSRSANMF